MASARRPRGGSRRRAQRGWLDEELRAARDGWAHVRDNAAATAVSVAVMAIAIALPALLFALLGSQQQLLAEWGAEPTVSAFLQPGTARERAAALAARWREDADVAHVELVTADEAFAELTTAAGLHGAEPGADNPLPHVLIVTPAASAWAEERGQALVARLEAVAEVDAVLVDFAWVDRLGALGDLAARAVAVLALVLVVGTVLIVGNTIRGLVLQQRAEIEVLKLVGATDAYVRRPFLYSGALHGLTAGVLAVILVETVYLVLAAPAARVAEAWLSTFVLAPPSPGFLAGVILVAAASGWCGAWLGTLLSLRQLEPAA